jgi:hypothetical protein
MTVKVVPATLDRCEARQLSDGGPIGLMSWK